MTGVGNIDKDYILRKHKDIYFECKGRIQQVRDYLETECGFIKDTWKTENHPQLTYLYVRADKRIHGTVADSVPKGYISANIDHLISDYFNVNEYKPINLKGNNNVNSNAETIPLR